MSLRTGVRGASRRLFIVLDCNPRLTINCRKPRTTLRIDVVITIAMDDDDSRPSYTNAHRALLQAFIANTTFTLPSVKPILAAIQTAHTQRDVLPGDIDEAELASYVSVINAATSQYDLEIRNTWTQPGQGTKYGDATHDEANGGSRTKVYALVNTTSDTIAQLATTHTAEEMAFMSRVLDDMFDRYNTESGKEIMAITQMQAMRLNKPDAQGRGSRVSNISATSTNGADEGTQAQTQAQGLTLKQAESMLASMIGEGWLEKTGGREKAYYVLTPRALMELKGWLLETYNEPGDPEAPSDDEDGDGPGRRGVERIKMCKACREIVTSGQRCADKRCSVRLHDACTGAMWRSQRGRRECPGCNREWQSGNYVGVRAAGVSLEDGRGNEGRRGSGRNGVGAARERDSNGGRRNRRIADEEDEDEAQAAPTTAGTSFATTATKSTLGRRASSGTGVSNSRRTSRGANDGADEE